VYLCGFVMSEQTANLSYTPLTEWFYNRDGVCLLFGTNWLQIKHITFPP
jgi:hypothetical protein